MKHLRPLSEFIVKKGLQTGPFGSQLKAEEYTATGIPVVMPKDISSGYIQEKSIVRIPDNKAEALKKHHLQEGDILFPRRGDLGRIGIATKNNVGWICGTGCLRARLDTSVLPEYMHQYLMRPEIKQWLENNALGQTMLNLNTEIIAQLPVYIPSFEEQRKVASILTDVDHAIETAEQMIAAKQRYFDGLIQNLLNHNPNKDTWKTFALRDYLKERNEKSTIHDEYPCLTSSRRGIFLQEEYFSKQVTSKNNTGYKIAQYGDFTFRSMSDDGIFVFNKQTLIDTGLISPAYGVFYVIGFDSDFMYYYMNSSIFRNLLQRETQGGTRTALKLSAIMKLHVTLPDKEEQSKIAEVLNTAKCEIDVLKKLAESYRLQKRGLMQKLLSGEWRVAA